MSALEQAPLSKVTLASERRSAPRLRIADNVPVLVGRGEGVLVDLSERGARVRHSVQARRGSSIRVTFEWEGQRFAATGDVLSSRVVALGFGDVPTVYESRLHFRVITDAAGELLARVLLSVENGDVRKWVANLHGWSDAATAPSATRSTGSYLRCRLLGSRWERKWTHDRIQPKDGFLLPESVDTRDVDNLCETYVGMDDEGRDLIRLMAAASLP
jgi:hypothetical protein